MRIQLLVAAIALFALSLATQGCLQTCSQLCAENARYIDGCLETWDAHWSDLGYDGLIEQVQGETIEIVSHDNGPAGEYQDSCVGQYSEAIGRSRVEEQYTVRDGCAEDLQLLASALGCYDYQPNDVALDPTAN